RRGGGDVAVCVVDGDAAVGGADPHVTGDAADPVVPAGVLDHGGAADLPQPVVTAALPLIRPAVISPAPLSRSIWSASSRRMSPAEDLIRHSPSRPVA